MDPLRPSAIAALLLPLIACAPANVATRPAADAPSAAPAKQPARPLDVGDKAPPFVVEAADGSTIDSADVLGKRPLVLVFFTTWCPWCERAMPLVREGLVGAPPDALVVAVSLDVDTWPDVPSYLARHRLTIPVVRAERAREFTMAYDLGGRIPHLVVVGRDGVVVDVQAGFDPDHADRLRAALELAGRPR